MATTIEELIFRVSADTDALNGSLEPFRRELHNLEDEARRLDDDQLALDLRMNVDDSDLSKFEQEELTFDIDISDSSRAQVERDLRQIQSLMEQVRIEPEVETAGVIAELDFLRSRISRMELDIDTAGAFAEIEAFILWLQTREIDLDVDVDEDAQQEIIRSFGEVFAGAMSQALGVVARTGIQFISGLAKSAVAAGPEIAAAVGAVVIAALAAAFALIPTLLAAGGGFGLLTVGIVGALTDPRVKAAATTIGEDILASFTRLTRPLQEPFIEAFAVIGNVISRLADELAPAFEKLGPIIESMASGFATMLDTLGPGIDALIGAAGPVLDEFVKQMPLFAAELTTLFRVLEVHADGLALIFRSILFLVNGLIGMLSVAIVVVVTPITAIAKILDWIYDKLGGVFDRLLEFLRKIPLLGPLIDLLTKITPEAEKGADGMKLLGDATVDTGEAAQTAAQQEAELARQLEATRQEAEQTAQTLERFFTTSFQTLMGWDQAVLGIADGWLALKDRFEILEEDEEAVARSFDLATQAGVDNMRIFLQQAQAFATQRDAAIGMGEDIFTANERFTQGITAIEDYAESIGFVPEQIDKLLERYKAIPAVQLTEIKAELSKEEAPDVVRAELAKVFGESVIQRIEASLDLDQIKSVRGTLERAFGISEEDPNALKLFAKLDPDFTQKVVEQIADIKSKTEVAQVPTSVVPAIDKPAMDKVVGQLTTLANTPVNVSIVPKMEPLVWNAAQVQLGDLAKMRAVQYIPYVNQGAASDVNQQLNTLARSRTAVIRTTSEGIRRGNLEGNSATGQATNLYVDSELVASTLRPSLEHTISTVIGPRRL